MQIVLQCMAEIADRAFDEQGKEAKRKDLLSMKRPVVFALIVVAVALAFGTPSFAGGHHGTDLLAATEWTGKITSVDTNGALTEGDATISFTFQQGMYLAGVLHTATTDYNFSGVLGAPSMKSVHLNGAGCTVDGEFFRRGRALGLSICGADTTAGITFVGKLTKTAQ
jgi:hypothetical protein